MLALESPLVQAEMVEATGFPELAGKIGVSGVPHDTINSSKGNVVSATVILVMPHAQEEIAADGGASAIPAEVSFPAPELTLTALQGKTSSFADHLGEVVLVNNWAT